MLTLKVENMKIWHTENPPLEGAYICRMDNGFIKMCYYKKNIWADIWQSNNITNQVESWMYIPYDK
jgi:hypothetical protein